MSDLTIYLDFYSYFQLYWAYQKNAMKEDVSKQDNFSIL